MGGVDGARETGGRARESGIENDIGGVGAERNVRGAAGAAAGWGAGVGAGGAGASSEGAAGRGAEAAALDSMRPIRLTKSGLGVAVDEASIADSTERRCGFC